MPRRYCRYTGRSSECRSRTEQITDAFVVMSAVVCGQHLAVVSVCPGVKNL